MGIFKTIKQTRPKRSAFNLSHERKQSLQFGRLYPMMLEEVVPGDTFKVNSEILLRFAPLISPVMHRIDVYTHYFFVPNRIVWDNWKTFITGGEDGLQTVSAYPRLIADNATNFGKGRLGDYLGIPPVTSGATNSAGVSALPFRAYAEIWNEYYRDQNLQDKIVYSKGDDPEPDKLELTELRYRAWEKDYFTSCLPWTQRGGEVTSPLTHTATDFDVVKNSLDEPEINISALGTAPDGSLQADPPGGPGVSIDNTGSLGLTINDLRASVRLQEWLEKNARAGSRYIEQILSHFGVRSSDARLQRPEFLGGGKNPVTISEVLQTSQTNTDQGPAVDPSVQANMAGHAISVGNVNGFKKSFEEHGYIIGIMSVMPRTAYQNGIHRTFLKRDKLEYAWPEFANLGEQEVTKSEVAWDPESIDGDQELQTFGYQSRYAEYKHGTSIVAGDFRDTLSHWHMARQLDENSDDLNEDFIQCKPRTDIFAVDDGSDYLYSQIYNRVKAIRPLPYYGTPRL